MISLRRLPLTWRLTLLFLIAAALMFSVTAVCFDWALNAQLQQRDDRELLGTIQPLRGRLQQANDIEAVRQNPERYLDVAALHDGLLLAIYDTQGKPLLASFDPPGAAQTLTRVAAGAPASASDIQPFTLNDEVPARALKAAARLGDGSLVDVVVARADTEREALLAHYHQNLLYIVAFGTLLSALLGVAVARGGLRPLRGVVRFARRISAAHLDERLRVEDAPAEVAELASAFNAMLARLDDSFARLSQFSADLAHDFRTPLNNLMIETQVALSQPRTPAEYQGLLESNVQEYERLARMIENMLFLARADHSKVALNKEWFALAPALAKIAEYFEGVAAEADVTLAIDAAGDVYADRLLFERALSNMVANAIRYTPAGKTVWLRGARHATTTVVEVANPGAGIRPDDMDKLFDRFYRADPARDSRSGATGLGLAIVKSIVTLHGGQVDVQSAAHGLTSFRLRFPVAADAERPPPAKAEVRDFRPANPRPATRSTPYA